MSAVVSWFGLAELKQQLERLPEELTVEATHIVEGAANAAAFGARSGYAAHRVTGNLQEHVVVVPGRNRGPWTTGFIVKNTARHAVIFENGTEARHTKQGWNRGRMPPGNVFIPAMMRARFAMYLELTAMLVRHTGWRVSGSAAA